MQEMWRHDALAGCHGMVIIVTGYVVIPYFHMAPTIFGTLYHYLCYFDP